EDSKNPAVRMVTLAHELVHVLQDQYYDTASMLDTLNDDEYIALTSLFEGEATYFESYYLYGMDEDAITDYFLYYNSIQDIQVEPIISDLVMFPYLEGFNFILEIIADNGIGYLDTVYNNPPETTEQIMHPEKYYSGELGVEVGAIEVEGMELIDENVLGESNIYIFLDQYLGTQDAEAGADGWNGDIYSYYERDEDHLLIFRSMWDDDQNAEEFMEMYTSFLQATPAGPFTIIEDTPERCIMESESGTVAITLDSNEVVVLSSNDADIVMELL
ncbi:MAG TPA: hypothetical protein PLC12_01225, partial [Candidatus Methanofastidiosa archaeon]|nr:hypothetical protein [Candidatus Methanofastidiosa archaeon]